jgi:hypothetical protein
MMMISSYYANVSALLLISNLASASLRGSDTIDHPATALHTLQEHPTGTGNTTAMPIISFSKAKNQSIPTTFSYPTVPSMKSRTLKLDGQPTSCWELTAFIFLPVQ